MAITGGTVGFEQSRKLAEYENRKAWVTFNVTDENGAAEECAQALEIAARYVYKALGLTPPAGTEEIGGKTEKPAGKLKTTTRRQSSGATKADDAAAVTDDEPQAGISTGEERKDPANPADDDPLTAGAEEVAKEVTDVELTQAISRKNAELIKALGTKGTPMIRKLLLSYVEQGQQAIQIPQEKRADFLKELAKLKP